MRTQAGFTVLEVLIVVLALAILGLIAYFVWG